MMPLLDLRALLGDLPAAHDTLPIPAAPYLQENLVAPALAGAPIRLSTLDFAQFDEQALADLQAALETRIDAFQRCQMLRQRCARMKPAACRPDFC